MNNLQDKQLPGESNSVKPGQTSFKEVRPNVRSAFIGNAIPVNRTLLEKRSEPSSQMPNDRFSMTNSQFRLNPSVAAGRAATLPLPWIQAPKVKPGLTQSQSVAVILCIFTPNQA
jgi:hypothetical protein